MDVAKIAVAARASRRGATDAARRRRSTRDGRGALAEGAGAPLITRAYGGKTRDKKFFLRDAQAARQQWRRRRHRRWRRPWPATDKQPLLTRSRLCGRGSIEGPSALSRAREAARATPTGRERTRGKSRGEMGRDGGMGEDTAAFKFHAREKRARSRTATVTRRSFPRLPSRSLVRSLTRSLTRALARPSVRL